MGTDPHIGEPRYPSSDLRDRKEIDRRTLPMPLWSGHALAAGASHQATLTEQPESPLPSRCRFRRDSDGDAAAIGGQGGDVDLRCDPIELARSSIGHGVLV